MSIELPPSLVAQTFPKSPLRARVKKLIGHQLRKTRGALRPLLFGGCGQQVYGLAISSDGNNLASAGADGRVMPWDIASATKLHEWQLPGPVHAVAFAHDGRHLATANGNGTVYILRIADGPPQGK